MPHVISPFHLLNQTLANRNVISVKTAVTDEPSELQRPVIYTLSIILKFKTHFILNIFYRGLE